MSALTGMTTGDPAGVGPEITVQARAARLDVEERILPGLPPIDPAGRPLRQRPPLVIRRMR